MSTCNLVRLLYTSVFVFLTLSSAGIAEQIQPRRLLDFAQSTCRSWDSNQSSVQMSDAILDDVSRIIVRGKDIGVKHLFRLNNDSTVELNVLEPAGRSRQFTVTSFSPSLNPDLLLSLSPDCEFLAARQINYATTDDDSTALNISKLDSNLQKSGDLEWLNPPMDPAPPVRATEPRIRVGMIDSGVNYRLPEINRALARDKTGALIGYDFWDMDNLPYDAHPVRSGFHVQRHGTRTASLLLSEAPGIELVAYRYPRPDMSRMTALIEHADKHQVHILGMPLGGNRKQEWLAFEQAARRHPHMLFVVSAGNNGRDIDDQPVYPASLALDNMLVVTSSDDFVRPAERTNWGGRSVDYLIPAENISVLDYSGKRLAASGSSYAVSRMTALVAKIKVQHPAWMASDIIEELQQRYAVTTAESDSNKWVAQGYIADPLAGSTIGIRALQTLIIDSPALDVSHKLSLDILVLDQRWSAERVQRTIQHLNNVYVQCAIAVDQVSQFAVDSLDYLRDLSTGTGHTLLTAAKKESSEHRATVVFARDTKMKEPYTGEAFGLGNTRSRPWLRYSVWLTEDVDDEAIALAHELYHVLSNSGEHVETSGNLMQSRTVDGAHQLTENQCERMRIFGVDSGLLSLVTG